MKEELQAIEVDKEVLAWLFCCSERTILRLAKEFGMPKEARNKFNLTACCQWYVNHLVARGKSADDDSITEERRQLVRAQRQRIELEIEKRRGELVEADAMAEVLNNVAGIVSRHLETLAGRISNTVAAETKPAAISELITHETRAIRNQISAAIIDYAATDGRSGNRRSAPTKERGRVGRPKKNATAGGAGTGPVAHQSGPVVGSNL